MRVTAEFAFETFVGGWRLGGWRLGGRDASGTARYHAGWAGSTGGGLPAFLKNTIEDASQVLAASTFSCVHIQRLFPIVTTIFFRPCDNVFPSQRVWGGFGGANTRYAFQTLIRFVSQVHVQQSVTNFVVALFDPFDFHITKSLFSLKVASSCATLLVYAYCESLFSTGHGEGVDTGPGSPCGGPAL